MARKTVPARPQPADLSVEQMQLGVQRLRKRIVEVETFDPGAVTADDPVAAVTPLTTSIDDALVRTFGNDTVEYRRYRAASHFNWPRNYLHETPIQEIQDSVAKCKQRALDLLSNAVGTLEERLEEVGGLVEVATAQVRSSRDTSNRNIFLVHGHETGPRESVARFLEQIGFSPVILHEQPNQGKTIIEKFEAHSDVGFAVVLLTPDDVGGVADGEQQRRARQNVILELGYFIGRLGREHVRALKVEDIEIPSDIFGVLWIDFDANGAWKTALAKELQAAGYEIDWNIVMG